MPDEASQQLRRRGGMLAEISTGLVQLHSRYYGKGPTRAKTHMFDDLVVCTLRGGFTTVERTLLANGDLEPVHGIRRSFQQAMEDEFRKVVEKATGRTTVAYMSTLHTNPELAVELFVLDPAQDGESEAQAARAEAEAAPAEAEAAPGESG